MVVPNLLREASPLPALCAQQVLDGHLSALNKAEESLKAVLGDPDEDRLVRYVRRVLVMESIPKYTTSAVERVTDAVVRSV